MCTEGGEYVHLELVQRFLKRGTDDISFSFKTTKKNGLLIYSKGTLRDYIFVAMKKGMLDVQLDLGTGNDQGVSAILIPDPDLAIPGSIFSFLSDSDS